MSFEGRKALRLRVRIGGEARPSLRVPVVDEGASVSDIARAIESAFADTFGKSLCVGVVRDDEGMALPPTACVVDLLADNAVVVVEEGAVEEAPSEEEKRPSTTELGNRLLSNGNSDGSGDAFAQWWEQATCKVLMSLFQAGGGGSADLKGYMTDSTLALLKSVSSHTSGGIRLESARAVRRAVHAAIQNAELLMPIMIRLLQLPNRNDVTLEAAGVSARTIVEALDHGDIGPNIIATHAGALDSVAELLRTANAASTTATAVTALVSYLSVDDGVRSSLIKAGAVGGAIAMLQDGLDAEDVNPVSAPAADLLVRLTDVGQMHHHQRGTDNGIDGDMGADIAMQGMAAPLDALLALARSSRVELQRVAAKALAAWLPEIRGNTSTARELFLGSDSDGMDLVWALADCDLPLVASRVACAVSVLGFEGKMAATAGKGLGNLLKWLGGEDLSTPRTVLDEVRRNAADALAVAVLHDSVKTAIERNVGLRLRCPIEILIGVIMSEKSELILRRSSAKTLLSLYNMPRSFGAVQGNDAFQSFTLEALQRPWTVDSVLLVYLKGFKF